MTRRKLNILFVCSGNICRSPMAEYILRYSLAQEYRQYIVCRSAGIHGYKGQPVPTQVIQLLQRDGIDIRPHRSQGLSDNLLADAHFIFAMTDRHKRYLQTHYPYDKDKVYLFGAFLMHEYHPNKHSIPDPFGGTLKMYEKIYKRITDQVTRILPHLYRIVDSQMDK